MTLPLLRQLAIETLVLPKSAAHRVLGVPIGSFDAAAGGLLAIIVGTLFGTATAQLLPAPQTEVLAALQGPPLVSTGLQFGFFLFSAWMVWAIGRAAGGTGSWRGALVIMAWLQVVTVGLQIAQVILFLALPPIGAMAGLVAVLWIFWALAAFIAALHGFRNELKVLGGIFMSMFGVAMLLFVLLSVAGLPLPEM